MNIISMSPIGFVHSSRRTVRDDDWDQEQVFVELDSSFTADALAGLSDFSHVEILFFMNQVEPSKIEMTARHPRYNKARPKVGIFAQRGKNRPNQIGATVCKLKKVEGLKLHLEGLDAINCTPVLDIKPWVQEFAPQGLHQQPIWMTELMHGYCKESKASGSSSPTTQGAVESCTFCKILTGTLPGNFVYRGNLSSAFLDIHPINDGHVLVLPNEHVQKFSELSKFQIADMFSVAQELYIALKKSDIRCEGANFILSEEKVAGQEVDHAHLHIVPRFKEDGQSVGFKHADHVDAQKLQELVSKINGSL